VQHGGGGPLSEAALPPAAGPHRRARGGAARGLRQAGRGDAGRALGGHPGRVQAERARQAERLAGTGLLCNAEMGPKEVRASCVVAEEAQGQLKAAMRRTTRSAWPS
jgi:hypothetical protein